MAIRQRQRAESSYLANPNICRFCHLPIPLVPTQKVSETRRKKFCGSSCAAKFNSPNQTKLPRKSNFCPQCGKQMVNRTRRCRNCYLKSRLSLLPRTKKNVFDSSKTWQAARSIIQRSARDVFELSSLPKQCKVCGYKKHYEVCHIKAVASFPDTATIGEINAIDNLKALCPTHHWEFDNLVKTPEITSLPPLESHQTNPP